MDLLRNPGSTAYGLLGLGAFLGALLEAFTLLLGFAYAGVMGDAPGDPRFLRYSIVAACGFTGASLLFIGMLGSSALSRAFPVITICGTSLSLLPIVPYAMFGVRGYPLLWVLLIIFVEAATLCGAVIKLKQLRFLR